MIRIRKILLKPFPFIEGLRNQLLISGAFGFFVGVFLLIFKPFGIHQGGLNHILFILGYGFLSFLVLSIIYTITSKLLSSTAKDNWTSGNMLVLSITVIVSNSYVNYWYSTYFGDVYVVYHGLISYLFYTIAVGIIPLTFLVIFLEFYLNRKNVNHAEKATNSIVNSVKDNKSYVHIGPENQLLKIEVNNLLCVKSQGNYVEVYFIKDSVLAMELMRFSLSKIGEQLAEYSFLKQCHRSFIANFNHIKKITGNARNFSLNLPLIPFNVPVSRSFPVAVIKDYKSN